MLQTLSYIINVAPDGVPQVVKLSQNENGRTLAFALTGVGNVNIPSGSTVTISGTKPDGVVFSATGTLSGNVASFSETTQMTAVSGIWPAKIKVTYNGETIATCKIVMAIDPDPVAPGSVPSSSQLNGLVAEAQQYATYAKYEAFGSPLVAATAAAMTDKTRVYVYTGSETGKTAGHWYYWNGSAWTDGGVYNSQGINTDTTLTISGMAADSGAVGAEFTHVKQDLSVFENGVSDTHHETVTADNHVYTFPKQIAEGTKVTITNKSSTTTFTVNFRKADGTSQNMSTGLSPGYTITVTAPFRTVDMRCYCNNTDWYFSVEYGENVVGRIDANIEDINKIVVRNSTSDEWGIGTLNSGVYDSSNNKRITDKNYIPIFNGCAVTVSPLLYVIHSYDADKNFLEATVWIASGTRTVINNNAVYIRIVAKVSDGYVFTDDDLVTYANCINIEYPINDCVQVLRSTQPNMDGVKAEIFDNVLVNSFNSAYHTGATNWAAKCAEYSQLINNSDYVECFLFFTDPHFFTRTDADWQNKLPEFIAEMQKYYNSTPTSFCLCGGDWLTAADSNATALFRLGYIDGFMNAMFDNYYPMFGNHDDNYQGSTVDGGTPATATPLEKQTVVNLWFKKFGKAYYTFEGTSTKFYVFDSGNDWNTNMTEYRWEQIDWFATALLTETAERIAVATHIAYNTTSDYTSGTLFPMTDNIGKIIQAYNNRTSVTLNGKSYNYASASGSVKFIIAGHLHADGVKTVYGVPLIITTNTLAVSTEPTFDMVYVDYDSDVIKLVRVGSGTSRTVNM